MIILSIIYIFLNYTFTRVYNSIDNITKKVDIKGICLVYNKEGFDNLDALNKGDIAIVGEYITVSGWVERVRDHGGVLFLDLRDTTETLQIVSQEERSTLIKMFAMKPKSVMFFIANRSKKIAEKYAGLIRMELGRKCKLIDEDRLELCIVKDFPMFEYDETTKKYEFCHNPFSMPHGGMAPGIDRIIMLITDEPNLREVQAFPTSSSGFDHMMSSPSPLTSLQLKELGIEVKEQV